MAQNNKLSITVQTSPQKQNVNNCTKMSIAVRVWSTEHVKLRACRERSAPEMHRVRESREFHDGGAQSLRCSATIVSEVHRNRTEPKNVVEFHHGAQSA